MGRRQLKLAAIAVVCALAAASIALASGRDHGNGEHGKARAKLSGFNEVPPILSNGKASVRVTINGSSLTYRLKISGTFSSNVTQAHLHFAEPGVNGGIFLFLCSNLGNGPAGTPACPQSGTVTRTVSAADFLAVPAQNVPAGSFDAAMRILRSGDTYANVHTVNFPAGEIRGQVSLGDDEHGHR
jgi:hypothetical protein